jgi:hypothetical protein
MVFNATFQHISVILWWSVLLLEETGVPVENQKTTASQLQTLSYNFVSSAPRHEQDSNPQGTDCIVSCKSNYYTITTVPTEYVILLSLDTFYINIWIDNSYFIQP